MRKMNWQTAAALLFLLLTAGPGFAADQDDTRAIIDALRREIERGGYGFQVDAKALEVGRRQNLNGYIPPPDTEMAAQTVAVAALTGDEADFSLPPRWNWMDYGGVTTIKNQRPAGTCWAFATVAAVECNILIRDGVEEDLSEQYLISCNTDGLGCNTGGWVVHKYFSPIPPGQAACDGLSGAVLEADFPYVCGDGEVTPGCAGTTGNPLPRPFLIDGFGTVDETVDAIKAAIFHFGPISVSVGVDTYFEAYAGGVFDRHFDSATNHCVSLVGWDDQQGKSGVWYLRNSWGSDWGEDGYMRIAYECSQVGSDPAYVVYGGGVENSAAIAALDAAGYAVGSDVGLIVRDADLAGMGGAEVTVATDGGDTETIAVSEVDALGNCFATLATTGETVVPNDGLLQVSDADVITIRYEDTDDGRGGTDVIRTSEAWVDGRAPGFAGLTRIVSGNGYVALEWAAAEDDHEPLSYRVDRRSDENEAWEVIATVSDLAYQDYTAVVGQDYHYRVRAVDAVGNLDDSNVILSGYALAARPLAVAGKSASGPWADAACRNSAISGEGRCLAFESSAGNLLDSATGDVRNVFVRDFSTGTVELISRTTDGEQGNAASTTPSISEDGRLVAIASYAGNLVGGDDNGHKDVFVMDRQTGLI